MALTYPPIGNDAFSRPDSSAPARTVAFDHLRGFVIALVVLHHSVLAYCRYAHFNPQHYLWSTAPIVDTERWAGFDLLVLCNDSFFMPLMFLLAGLFVWPSLVRKGAGPYLRGRVLRLGLPFAVASVTLMPLAYYPSFRMTGAAVGFGRFWSEAVLAGPWPSGPPWFIAVLLAFDFGAAAFYALTWRHRGIVARTGPLRPGACFGLLAALSAAVYLPPLYAFGPARWLAFGPFAVQASRVLLYAVYFGAGVAAGRQGLVSGILASDGPLQRRWARWTALAVLLFLALTTVVIARLTDPAVLPPPVGMALAGCALVLFCAAAAFALLAAVLRFARRRNAGWDSLAANAYGIYLLHYPIVTWTQYALLEHPMTAILKASLVFLTALLLSWAGASLLRRIPGAAHAV